MWTMLLFAYWLGFVQPISCFNSVDEARVRQQLVQAVARVRQVLDANRNPQFAGDVPHTYEDKYVLAQSGTQTAIAAELNTLSALLLVNETQIGELVGWAQQNRTVTLRLRAEAKTEFLRTVEREVESASRTVVDVKKETTGWMGSSESTQVVHKVITKVTDYYWQISVTWELMAYAGSGSRNENRMVLFERTGETERITSTNSAPSVPQPVLFDVDITWLFRNLHQHSPYRPVFAIDRSVPSCHTPRRNKDINAALAFFEQLRAWSEQVRQYFRSKVFVLNSAQSVEVTTINADGCFVPTLPMLERKPEGGPLANASCSLLQSDLNQLLVEQSDSLLLKVSNLRTKFLPSQLKAMVSIAEARVVVAADHMIQLHSQYSDLVNSVEWILRKQLNAAIGREITAEDFGSCMWFHGEKLFLPQYKPQDFSVAVRRPVHDPEGLLSIERVIPGDSTVSAIKTFVRRFDQPGDSPMHFEVSAGVRVTFTGAKYLHVTLLHQFSGTQLPSLQLLARTRQFSSFMLLVGQIASAGKFEPSHAIMLQNKDELRVALSLESFPNAKQFADAIESMSPEQQAFAKAFRAMQLGTTLFGLCVIQIKPQLELLLNLPSDSLTKEIQLAEDLLELFLQYQVPSDLLSYDGRESASTGEKLQQVKANVQRMQAMVAKMKAKELMDDQMAKQKGQPAVPRVPVQVVSTSEHQRLESETVRMPVSIPQPYQVTIPRATRVPVTVPQIVPVPVSVPQPYQVTISTPVKSTPDSAASPESPPADKTKDANSEEQSTTEVFTSSKFRGLDVTTLPHRLDDELFQFDKEAAVRPAIIKLGSNWRKRSFGLVGNQPSGEGVSVSVAEQKQETSRAFDLLDSLSKGGALPLQEASLHVLTASVHTFDQTLLDTVIEGNVNPIEKVENSMLILASAINDKPARALIEAREVARLTAQHPLLFPKITAASTTVKA